jgi:hypothetical protein
MRRPLLTTNLVFLLKKGNCPQIKFYKIRPLKILQETGSVLGTLHRVNGSFVLEVLDVQDDDCVQYKANCYHGTHHIRCQCYMTFFFGADSAAK